jgi:hypothetical protein
MIRHSWLSGEPPSSFARTAIIKDDILEKEAPIPDVEPAIGTRRVY